MSERLLPVDSQDQVEIARNIESRLWEANIAYGPDDDPRLWRISPRYFVIRQQSLDQIKAQAAIMPRIVHAINSLDDDSWNPSTPYYFRFDATVDDKGKVVPMEFQNEVPVEDATVDTNRGIYEDLVPLPAGCSNPFVGSVNGITRALKRSENSHGGVGIVVPSTREYYLRDYRKTARMLQQRGINAWVEEGSLDLNGDGLHGTNGRIHTVYRAFTRKDLLEEGRLIGNDTIKRAYETGQVDIFPQFSSAVEDKGVMAALFMPDFQDRLTDALGGEEAYRFAQSQFPFTWLCNAGAPPTAGGKERGWGSYYMSEGAWKEGYVLKPRRSFGSAGMFTSRDLSLPKWREAVLEALTNQHGNYVIQKQVEQRRFWAEVLEGGQIVRTDPNLGVRLSVTCIVEEGNSEVVEVDACLSRGSRVHGTRESVLMPVVVKGNKHD
ncbi:hypothetical protein A3A75_06465 [Candidatus Woesebacteria bacterium RIFCSPLOWO2_01_FULL_39_10]|uniref:Glutathionylspermidine synthase pre-ATP-grasp-like domain-containing protein n=1 Tax=Candidatus Woesebacteria bacterium RIFCSPLOWO2_01_FULL_39_10 TaxID=1802516 RepID=A0A1F8B4G0_9BACT|nr:MAG: hypothetical protein A3A75_06465 [Candidatus Woesebacteria bacterium RIFCSPLOWO2_01_FULL_39_10]